MAVNYVKFQRGTQAAYNKLANAVPSRLDENTLYFIYPEDNSSVGKLYLGTRLINGTDINTFSNFKAGAILEIDFNDTGDIIYSHKELAAPAEMDDDSSFHKFLTSIKTDGYGHIIGFTSIDSNKFANNDEAKANGGIRYINQEEINKLTKLIVQGDDVVVSGSVNADSVIGLNEWITAQKNTISGLVSDQLESNVSKAVQDLDTLFKNIETGFSGVDLRISSIESDLNKYILATDFQEAVENVESNIEELRNAMTWKPIE